MERSYLMIKPGFTQYEEEIMEMLKRADVKLIARKKMNLTADVLKEHYAHLTELPFYPSIESYMMSDRVIGMVVEGPDGVIEKIREVVGPTKAFMLKEEEPKYADTIRGRFATGITENVIHASDSVENANAEIVRFFGKDYLI